MTPHIHSRVLGEGPRQALAIHCSLAHSGAWRGLAEAVRGDLSLLAYDLPSHGKSGDWDRTGNVHDLATDMARSLLESPMDLVGHSFGATVALRIAVESPELVRSLTLIEPVYYAALLEDDAEMREVYAKRHAPFTAAFRSGDMEEAARIFNRDWGDGTRWKDIPQATRQYMIDRFHFVPASSPFLRDDSAGLLAAGRFARASMPGLLMQGGESAPISDQINASLARRMPQLERVTIEGAGHMAPLSHPQPVADALRGLLARS